MLAFHDLKPVLDPITATHWIFILIQNILCKPQAWLKLHPLQHKSNVKLLLLKSTTPHTVDLAKKKILHLS